jgi:hypothetical protein
MSWSCGACRRIHRDSTVDEDHRIVVDAVCHHCGKPLCTWEPDDDSDREACQHWILDEAFRGDHETLKPACHCRDCLRTHHPAARLISRPVGDPQRGAAP